MVRVGEGKMALEVEATGAWRRGGEATTTGRGRGTRILRRGARTRATTGASGTTSASASLPASAAVESRRCRFVFEMGTAICPTNDFDQFVRSSYVADG